LLLWDHICCRYKLSTNPSRLYHRDPQLWGVVAALGVGLTVAGAGLIQWATWRAYESLRVSPQICVSDLREINLLDEGVGG
jgi:hypothetical protein